MESSVETSHCQARATVQTKRGKFRVSCKGFKLNQEIYQDTDWKTIDLSEVKPSDNDVYLIKHTLKNLEPGVYETRARSRNSNGWSDYSNIVPFEQG